MEKPTPQGLRATKSQIEKLNKGARALCEGIRVNEGRTIAVSCVMCKYKYFARISARRVPGEQADDGAALYQWQLSIPCPRCGFIAGGIQAYEPGLGLEGENSDS